jgi:hypothetical protein
MSAIQSIYSESASAQKIDEAKRIVNLLENGHTITNILEQNPTFNIIVAPQITNYGIRAEGLIHLKTEKTNYIIWYGAPS